MADRNHTPPMELVSAGSFGLGCLGLCALLLWLGPDGAAPGFASYIAGLIIAREIDARWGQGPYKPPWNIDTSLPTARSLRLRHPHGGPRAPES